MKHRIQELETIIYYILIERLSINIHFSLRKFTHIAFDFIYLK